LNLNKVNQDIVVEGFDKPKVSKPDFLQHQKVAPSFPFKPKVENDQLINVFSSVGNHGENDSINFNLFPNCESQDLNVTDNFCKNEANENKLMNVAPSNISQILESVEGCGDYYFQKQILDGGMNLVNNMTPAFSMTEELAEPIRPNGLEINDIANPSISVSNNLPGFNRDGDCEMMLTEEFKQPNDGQNH